MRFIGSKYAKICGRGSAPDPTGGASSAPPDLLAGKEGGAPGMPPPPEGGTPGKERERKKRGGVQEGENCCHQMSDFTAKMRGRAI